MTPLSTAQATAILDAAQKQAEDMGILQNIAVVDVGANLLAFRRMAGAWLGSIDIAITKAKTARFFDMPTGDLGKMSQPGKPLYAIEHSNGGLISFPGGLLLKTSDGEIVGAIGVSGSTVDDDEKVAQAGVDAFIWPRRRLQTKTQRDRFEQILTSLGETPGGETCQAMKGLVEEGQEMIASNGDDAVRDAGIIAAAQRVEHYELAG